MRRSMNRLNSELDNYQDLLKEKDEESRQQRQQMLAFKNHISDMVMKQTDSFLNQLPDVEVDETQ